MSITTQSLFPVLGAALEVAALRQGVHAANVANANVTGYRPLTVSFRGALADLMQQRERGNGNEVATDLSAYVRPVRDGQAVAIDREMALMSRDATHYQVLLAAVSRESSLLRMAIWEGKGG